MRSALKFLAVILVVSLAFPPALQISYANPQYAASNSAYSDDELDQMLASIALYPDPLLAQILPAASFIDQISKAQSLLNGRVDDAVIQDQNWDISVKAIAHYPSLLNMMSQNPDWTAAVGQAYVMQQPGVEKSIQRLRAQAEEAGVLQSNAQQQVTAEPNVISIEPAQSDVIYVPSYDPDVLLGYDPGGYSSGFLTFGTGFAIGSWLNRDWDWHGRGPYYHGWRGGGWIGANRRFVDTNNHFYVNDQFRDIHVNRNVVNRDVGNFRATLDRNASAHRKFENAPRPGTPAAAVPQPGAPAPGAARREKPTPAAPGPITPAPVAPRPAVPAPTAPQPKAPGPVAPGPVTPAPVAPRPAVPAPTAPQPKAPGPVAPGPVTPAPVAPRPAVPAPTAPQPKAPVPVAPGPVTPAPVAPRPAIPAPTTPRPMAPAPVAPGPVTPAPVAPRPMVPAPAAPRPMVPAPAAPRPMVPAPVAPRPMAPSPVAPRPMTPAPVAPRPAAPAPAPPQGGHPHR